MAGFYDRIADPQSFLKLAGEAIAGSGLYGAKNSQQGFVIAWHCFFRNEDPFDVMMDYDLMTTEAKCKLSKKSEAMLRTFAERGGTWEWLKDGRDGVAELKLMRDGKTYTAIYTIQDAAKAGLVDGKNPNWKKRPQNMLRSRVSSEGIRMFDPASCEGYYTPDELNDSGFVGGEDDESSASSPQSTEAAPAAADTAKRGRGRPPKQPTEPAANQPATTAPAEQEPASVEDIVGLFETAAQPQPETQPATAAPSSTDPVINEIIALKGQMIGYVGKEKFSETWSQAFNALKIPTGQTDEARLLLVAESVRVKVRDWLSGQARAAEAKQSKNDLNAWANTTPNVKPQASATTAT